VERQWWALDRKGRLALLDLKDRLGPLVLKDLLALMQFLI
jgi:hypothetical protein